MRVSTVRDDPGYIDWAIASDINIYLDGRKQDIITNGRAVITADDDAGMIIYHKTKNGTRGMVLECDDDGEYIRFYAYGRVEIRGMAHKDLIQHQAGYYDGNRTPKP